MSRNPDNPSYRKLSYPQARKVEEFLKSGICNREGEYAVYAPGWDDQRVAKHLAELNPDMSFVSDGQVKNIRRPMIGKMRLPNGALEGPIGRPRAAATQEDISLLRKQLAEVVDMVQRRQDQPQLPYQPFRPLIPMLERLAKVEARVNRLFEAFDLKDEA